jgi:hypothetical protein
MIKAEMLGFDSQQFPDRLWAHSASYLYLKDTANPTPRGYSGRDINQCQGKG